ncbi:hypothetical protein AB0K43_02235 [Kitasatospora sp. NPDC049258]
MAPAPLLTFAAGLLVTAVGMVGLLIAVLVSSRGRKKTVLLVA